jgi:hypothetical protein
LVRLPSQRTQDIKWSIFKLTPLGEGNGKEDEGEEKGEEECLSLLFVYSG